MLVSTPQQHLCTSVHSRSVLWSRCLYNWCWAETTQAGNSCPQATEPKTHTAMCLSTLHIHNCLKLIRIKESVSQATHWVFKKFMENAHYEKTMLGFQNFFSTPKHTYLLIPSFLFTFLKYSYLLAKMEKNMYHGILPERSSKWSWMENSDHVLARVGESNEQHIRLTTSIPKYLPERWTQHLHGSRLAE